MRPHIPDVMAMRVLHYNILDGCQDDPLRLRRLGAWLRNQAFDVVGLNELNGWDRAPDIAQKAKDWGYTDSSLFQMQGSRHFVGILSKHPIQSVETIEDGFHHGVLIALINDVHYIITHLTPMESRKRESETVLLASIVRRIQGPLLLLGDLNTLSPLDSQWHESSNLLGVLRSSPLLTKKFLDNDHAIHYTSMQNLLNAGLVDLCANGSQTATVPTASNTDIAHAAHMRLDYILANQAFLDERTPEAHILQEDPLPDLSDHFPVTCRW